MMVPNRRKGDLMNQEEVLERLKEELELPVKRHPFPVKLRTHRDRMPLYLPFLLC